MDLRGDNQFGWLNCPSVEVLVEASVVRLYHLNRLNEIFASAY